ncbi:MAG: MFS transporter [Dehalococcoidia bacterium]
MDRRTTNQEIAATLGRTAAAGALYTTPVVTVLLSSMSFGFALSTFYLLPKYLLVRLQASAFEIGVITSVFGLATVAATPLLAVWIGVISRRRLIVAGSLAMSLSSAAFILIKELGIALILLRALQGFGFAVVFTAVTALVSELAPVRRMSEALGLAGASMLIMNAVAPPLMEGLARSAGWNAVFATASVSALFAAGLALLIEEEQTTREANAGPGVLREFVGRARTKHYAYIIAALGAAFGAMFTFAQPFAMELGRQEVGGFFFAYASTAIALRLFFGGLPDRLGRYPTAVLAINLYTLAVMASSAMKPDLLEMAGVALGIAHGVFFPAFNGMMMASVPSWERGRVMAVFTASFYGGLSAGVLIFGVVAELLGYAAVFLAAGATTFAAGGLLVLSPEFRNEAYRPLPSEQGAEW